MERKRAPAARRGASSVKTKLAAARLRRGLTQREVAERSGISYATYQRLERGEIDNPPLRYLTNCALLLGVRVGDLIEDEWLQWKRFDETTPDPPTQDARWRQWRDPR
jgi:transcriptional regulator with XRE-family HTH domain